MIDNQDLKLDGVYSVDNGTLKKGTETPIQIPTTGTAPSVGWIKIKENEVTKGCLTIGDYKVELNDKHVTAEKGECDSTIPSVKFDEDTPWEDIIEALQDGDPIEGIEVGKEKKVKLTGFEGTYTLRIANLSSPENEGCGTKAFSETACGVVLEFTDIIIDHRMSSTGNVGGWETSEMREYVNNDIYNALPPEIKKAIIETTVVSGHGSTGTESNFTTTDWLYLLSPKEVWNGGGCDWNSLANPNCESSDSALDKTRQLDYYKEKKVTLSDNIVEAKKYKVGSTSASYWWLRSADYYNINFFNCVDSSGINTGVAAGYPASGVAPAFRIAE